MATPERKARAIALKGTDDRRGTIVLVAVLVGITLQALAQLF